MPDAQGHDRGCMPRPGRLPAFPAGRSAGCAFTLVEVVLVLAIVGVLAALAAPRYARHRDRYRVELAAGRIAADLQWAMAHARATGTTRTVYFVKDSDHYYIQETEDPDRPGNRYTVELWDEPYRCDLVNVALDTKSFVEMTPYGSPKWGGTIEIQSGDVQKTITLEWETGKVTIE